MYSAVLEFAGPVPQADDLTAVVVKRVENPDQEKYITAQPAIIAQGKNTSR
jgi:hypothetical protein